MPFSAFLTYCAEQQRYERAQFADQILATNIGTNAKPDRIDTLIRELRS